MKKVWVVLIIVIVAIVLFTMLKFLLSFFFPGCPEDNVDCDYVIPPGVLEQLRKEGKKITIPSSRVEVDSGNQETFPVEIKNTKTDGDLTYQIAFNVLKMNGDIIIVDEEELQKQIGFIYDDNESILSVNESTTHEVEIEGKGIKGNYLVRLQVIDTAASDPLDQIYDQRTFFVMIE
ncbi:MAG: hypothetical protein ABH824_04405 [Nanoarchaeota archaeon]|nr:hypothetical protein [Nanoarchaeota archaeon]MBU1632638.1 hypothetical protein [Nanoarchaeota archaeon]MBU1876539.1 hypothetical protein [Nanoarchaeota archaeon]